MQKKFDDAEKSLTEVNDGAENNIGKTQADADEKWMEYALKLALRGTGHVNPNPLVGAVIIKDGKVIGEGWHQRCGELHAERNALKDCVSKGNDPAGATIYVTLEPCCHYGKTPPCTDAIMENKLRRVVFGAWDANPLVKGKGIKILRDAGIQAEGPVKEQECLAINKIFFYFIQKNRPYVILKYAMTADGKIAAHTGDSKWVTGDEARRHVHITRQRVAAIMVGINTVLADDPMLNCRLDENYFAENNQILSNPIRIVCDSRLRIPLDSQIVRTADEIRTIIAYAGARDDAGAGANASANVSASAGAGDGDCRTGDNDWREQRSEKIRQLKLKHVELLSITPDTNGKVDIKKLMIKLAEMKIDSVLLEGGAELNFSALKSGAVSKVQVYIAPKIIGGAESKTPVGGMGIDKMADCINLGQPCVSQIGNDILLEYEVEE